MSQIHLLYVLPKANSLSLFLHINSRSSVKINKLIQKKVHNFVLKLFLNTIILNNLLLLI